MSAIETTVDALILDDLPNDEPAAPDTAPEIIPMRYGLAAIIIRDHKARARRLAAQYVRSTGAPADSAPAARRRAAARSRSRGSDVG